MEKTLKDYLFTGGIGGRSFVCVEGETPRYVGKEYLNTPYRVEWLSSHKGTFSINVTFYNNPINSTVCLNLETSLGDLEASQQQISVAKKERESNLETLAQTNQKQ